MKTEKYKYFELTLQDGTKIQVKTPSAKLTLEYASKLAYHWAKIDKDSIINIVGLK